MCAHGQIPLSPPSQRIAWMTPPGLYSHMTGISRQSPCPPSCCYSLTDYQSPRKVKKLFSSANKTEVWSRFFWRSLDPQDNLLTLARRACEVAIYRMRESVLVIILYEDSSGNVERQRNAPLQVLATVSCWEAETLPEVTELWALLADSARLAQFQRLYSLREEYSWIG